MTHALPPGPKGLPGAGIIFAYRRDPLGFLTRMARQYGDIVSLPFGPFRSVMLSDPDDIKELLVTQNRSFHRGPAHRWLKLLLGEGLLSSEGEFHLRQRRLIQPAFHRQRIAAYGEAMTHYALETSDRWRDGQPVDMAREMLRLTLGIVGKTLFDAEITEEAGEVGPASGFANTHMSNRSNQLFGMVWQQLPLPSNRRFRQARARLDATVYRMIAERRASGEDRGDLLSMLLLAQDAEGDGRGMTDQQVRDEAMTLFIAGHETTANALTWTWYLLAQHPEVAAKLHAELDAVLGGRAPTADDLPRLRYAEMVLSESMRLYPPAWGLVRTAAEEVHFGPYTVPKGTVISAVSYVVHRDPRFFPDPLRFDPERWTPEAKAARPRFAYFPFGGGPRQCIGEPFAWMEATLAMATLAQRWSLRLIPDQRIALLPIITLRPRYGLQMLPERRQAGALAARQPLVVTVG